MYREKSDYPQFYGPLWLMGMPGGKPSQRRISRCLKDPSDAGQAVPAQSSLKGVPASRKHGKHAILVAWFCGVAVMMCLQHHNMPQSIWLFVESPSVHEKNKHGGLLSSILYLPNSMNKILALPHLLAVAFEVSGEGGFACRKSGLFGPLALTKGALLKSAPAFVFEPAVWQVHHLHQLPFTRKSKVQRKLKYIAKSRHKSNKLANNNFLESPSHLRSAVDKHTRPCKRLGLFGLPAA